jgi:hypothetical protein
MLVIKDKKGTNDRSISDTIQATKNNEIRILM